MDILRIRHLTRYRYAKPVQFGEHRMMFRPRESFAQHVLDSRLKITPEPSNLRYMHDVFGNCVGVANFDAPADEIVFESLNRLEHSPEYALDPPLSADGGMNSYPFAYSPSDLPDIHSSMLRGHRDKDRTLETWARSFLETVKRADATHVLAAMTRGIHDNFKYSGRAFGPPQSPQETLRLRQGSCRDFAVLMMEAVRCLGLAARFVSGYLFVPDMDTSETTSGGATHAWMQVYLPGAGWVDFDPTNNIIGNHNLIRVAVAWDHKHVLPLWGTYLGKASSFLGMDVTVSVTEDTR